MRTARQPPAACAGRSSRGHCRARHISRSGIKNSYRIFKPSGLERRSSWLHMAAGWLLRRAASWCRREARSETLKWEKTSLDGLASANTGLPVASSFGRPRCPWAALVFSLIMLRWRAHRCRRPHLFPTSSRHCLAGQQSPPFVPAMASGQIEPQPLWRADFWQAPYTAGGVTAAAMVILAPRYKQGTSP